MNKLFKALDDPTRRQILEMLKKGDLTAGEIADAFKMSKPGISHHLEILRNAELVESEKKGQFVTYTINTSVLVDALKWLLDLTKNNKGNNDGN